MQVGREPVTGLQVCQEFRSSRTDQSIRLNLLTQELILSQELDCATVMVDPAGPVMGHEYVNGQLELRQKKINDRERGIRER